MRMINVWSVAPALLAALALAACSSDDDGPTESAGTSALNPDLDVEQPPSGTPGGDTAAIAGLWDATETVTRLQDGQSVSGADVAYVLISADGVWTRYDYDADIAGSPEQGNCYRTIGPFTLTPESGIQYSLAGEEEPLELGINDVGDRLSVDFGAGRDAMTWPRTTGEVSVEDFDECTVSAGSQEPDPAERG